MAMQSLIRDISEAVQSQRRWQLRLDGKIVKKVAKVELENQRFGLLSYGMTPGNYDGWAFHEKGGGGVATLPFVKLEGEIYVGLIAQNRPNQGGHVWNAPRGFLDADESKTEAAQRELHEETGILIAEKYRLIPLPGEPANPNSAFFETWQPGEGVRFFAVELPASSIERTGDEFLLHPGSFDNSSRAKDKRMAEQIEGCRFIPWHEAACVSDMFSVAAVGRLLAYLR